MIVVLGFTENFMAALKYNNEEKNDKKEDVLRLPIPCVFTRGAKLPTSESSLQQLNTELQTYESWRFFTHLGHIKSCGAICLTLLNQSQVHIISVI